jgi:hypothetical protein
MKRSILVLASLLFVGTARADDAKAHAKEAYARGLAAHDRGDFKAAARAFAEADAALPSPTALTAALDDAVAADDPVIGAELLERARARNVKADAARAKLGGRAGRIRIICPSGSTCSMLVDEQTATSELWVTLGSHQVTTKVDSAIRDQKVDVHADETVTLTLDKPAPQAPVQPAPVPPPIVETPPPPPQQPIAKHGLPPVVVYVTGAITIGLGAGTVVFGIIANGQHDDFVAKGCNKGPVAGCTSMQSDGRTSVALTNVMLAGAIVGVVATSAFAIWFTDWHASVAPTAGGAIGGLERRF